MFLVCMVSRTVTQGLLVRPRLPRSHMELRSWTELHNIQLVR